MYRDDPSLAVVLLVMSNVRGLRNNYDSDWKWSVIGGRIKYKKDRND